MSVDLVYGGSATGTYLVGESEEVDGDGASAASCQWGFICSHTEEYGSCQCDRRKEGVTYVLSLACFKLSRNFKPAVVVDSTVSDRELGVSACTEAVSCQH